ncbi:hypothetical protein KQX54_005895 [Cotesia glomerata]|uniref:Uncharacterized protein n=1 Tax=Cotesia glomerata TaxID=32391 RepID=A0AAV7IXR9_COTGL|nr:hypothetical protein KQX54_005895 [Cotesia glomerata]
METNKERFPLMIMSLIWVEQTSNFAKTFSLCLSTRECVFLYFPSLCSLGKILKRLLSDDSVISLETAQLEHAACRRTRNEEQDDRSCSNYPRQPTGLPTSITVFISSQNTTQETLPDVLSFNSSLLLLSRVLSDT